MSESCGFDLPMLGAMNDQYRGARGLHRKILPVSVSETKARGRVLSSVRAYVGAAPGPTGCNASIPPRVMWPGAARDVC